MHQATFAFVIDAPDHPDLDGAPILIEAPDAAEADRLAAMRAKAWRTPLRRAVAVETFLARGVA